MDQAEVAFVRDALGDAFQHHRDSPAVSPRRRHRRAESQSTVGTVAHAESAPAARRLSGSVSGRAGRAAAAGIAATSGTRVGRRGQHRADAFQQDVRLGEHVHAHAFRRCARSAARHAAGRDDQQRLRRKPRAPCAIAARYGSPCHGFIECTSASTTDTLGVVHQQRRHLAGPPHAAEDAQIERIADAGEHLVRVDRRAGCSRQRGERHAQALRTGRRSATRRRRRWTARPELRGGCRSGRAARAAVIRPSSVVTMATPLASNSAR